MRALIGEKLDVSDWFLIDQEKIDAHAKTTGDADWLHNDPVRAAKESPFDGKTIAQGFLLLAQFSQAVEKVLPYPPDIDFGLNYGFNRIRFINPVKVDTRVRNHIVLKDLIEKSPNTLIAVMEVTVENEGSDDPAVVAEWLGLMKKKEN